MLSTLDRLHEEADTLDVPTRFILIYIPQVKKYIMSDEYSLEHYPNATFTTTFEYITELEKEIEDIGELWNFFKKWNFEPIEFVYMWIYNGKNIEDNFDDIRVFMSNIKEPMVEKTPDRFTSRYEKWLSRFDKEREDDRSIAKERRKNRKKLERIKGIYMSDISVETRTMIYETDVTYGFDPLPDIFNSIVTSRVVPFVIYNSEKTYWKIHKNTNHNVTTLKMENNKAKDTIYLNLWKGKGEPKDIKNGYTKVIISFVPGVESRLRLKIVVPTSIQDLIFERLNDHVDLPQDIFNESKYNKVSGSFSLYNITLNDIILVHLVMLDPLFNMLYLEESNTTLPSKKSIKIYMKGSSSEVLGHSIFGKITESMKSEGSIVVINGTKQKISKSMPIVNVDFSGLPSVMDDFALIISKLYRRILDKGQDIVSLYREYIPEWKRVTKESGKVTRKKLRNIVPDIFVSGWARDCQPVSRHPDLIDINEIDKWKRKTFTKNNKKYHRQVLSFPKDNPIINVVCKGANEPFPGVRVNRRSNSEKYPYLPCCFATDQFNKLDSDYNKYIGKYVNTKNSSEHIISTEKLLTEGRLGTNNTMVNSFLKRYSKNSGEFLRLGVPRSKNSFIHCIATALDYGNYNTSNKEKWTNKLRNRIFTLGVHPNILKQQLYGLSDDEIIEKVKSDTFFDPLLYYRALEEFFDCSIFIFRRNDMNETNGKKTSLLDIPRFTKFLSSPYRKNRTVLVLRYMGSERDALDYPQCEIICEQRTNLRTVFGNRMYNLVYPAFTYVSKTLTWEFEKDKIITRENLYSKINYNELFGNIPVVGQTIDSLGKTRMISIAPEYDFDKDDFTNLRIYINIPPTQPFNVENIETINPPNADKLIEMFGNPIAYTGEKEVDGLWFSVGDIKYGFHCPCKDTNVKNLERVPMVNLVESNTLTRYRTLEKSAKFFDQVVKYLYTFDRINPKRFLKKYFAYTDSDSMVLYKDFPRVLPRGSTTKDIIRNMKDMSMISNGKVLLNSKKLAEGVLFALEMFRKRTEGLEIPDLGQLQDYYVYKSDFKKNKNEYLLDNNKEFNEWVEEFVPSPSMSRRNAQNLKKSIQYSLNHSSFFYMSPYIFKSGDVYYIVQNVVKGELLRAINIALEWYLHKRNLGFYSMKLDGKIPEYKIYNINANGDIDKTNCPIEILEYSSGTYGALLRI